MTESEALAGSYRLRSNQWIVLALGLNAWVVIDVWPLAFPANQQAWQSYLLLLSPTLLLLATRGMRRRPSAARWILLALFPVSLIAPVVVRSEIDNQLAFTPVVLLFAVLSLVAYFAFIADALSVHVPYRHCDYKSLALPGTPTIQPARVWLRRTIVGLALLGSLCVVATGPAFSGFRGLKRDWGDASMQAGLLITLVASTLAIAVLLSFLGPALKAFDGRRPARAQAARKLISALILSLFGLLTFYLLHTR